MSVQKTPVALIQILDSEGKVSGLEIEYSCVYAGNDPDIAKSFTPGRRREEATPEQFEALAGKGAAESVAELGRLAQQIEAMRGEHAKEKEALEERLAAAEAAAQNAALEAKGNLDKLKAIGLHLVSAAKVLGEEQVQS